MSAPSPTPTPHHHHPVPPLTRTVKEYSVDTLTAHTHTVGGVCSVTAECLPYVGASCRVYTAHTYTQGGTVTDHHHHHPPPSCIYTHRASIAGSRNTPPHLDTYILSLKARLGL